MLEGFKDLRVAPDAPAVFGRTGPFARDAHRMRRPRPLGQSLLDLDLVLPRVAEIIFVFKLPGSLAPAAR